MAPTQTPNETTSAASAGNGDALCSCGATTRSAKSDQRCANGHLLRGNRAAAIVGNHGADFWREQATAREDIKNRLLRDAGFANPDDAQLILQIGIETIAEATVIRRMAYRRMVESGGPLSESGKPRRAYSVWAASAETQMRDWRNHVSEYIDSIRENRSASAPAFADASIEELIAINDGLAAQLRELLQSAVRIDPLDAPLPTPDTRPPQDAALSRNLPATSTEPQLAGLPASEPVRVSPGRDSRASSRPSSRASGPSPDPDAEPEVWAYGRRVTARDVEQCLADTGDEAAYREGRISTSDAYERTPLAACREGDGAMTKPTISADEYRLGIDMFFNDHLYLARWAVIRFPAAAEKHAMVALTFNAECDWSWRKLASYAIHELKAIEAERQLTPLERDIRRIAEQVYDAKVSVADRFGLDLFPEDTDRAAARRDLDERFQRALEELKPYFSKKEPTIQ